MITCEISARFLLSFFLAWVVLSNNRIERGWFKCGLLLSLIACGFGITSELTGVYSNSVSFGALLAIAILGAAFIVKISDSSFNLLSLIPFAVVFSTGCFTGQGAVAVAILLTLFSLILEVVFSGKSVSEGDSDKGFTLLTIKAQEIRGIIGRVEAVLDRLQLNVEQITVNNNMKEKELGITMKVALPSGFEKEYLISAIREVEGIIQLAIGS